MARSPRAARAAFARETRSGSLAAGISPAQVTPRSESGSEPLPSSRRLVTVEDDMALFSPIKVADAK